MAVSDRTQQLVREFEGECGHLFDGFHVQYTINSENEIYIAFNSADKWALALLTKLSQQISNSSQLRLGDELKNDFPFVGGKVVLHIF